MSPLAEMFISIELLLMAHLVLPLDLTPEALSSDRPEGRMAGGYCMSRFDHKESVSKPGR